MLFGCFCGGINFWVASFLVGFDWRCCRGLGFRCDLHLLNFFYYGFTWIRVLLLCLRDVCGNDVFIKDIVLVFIVLAVNSHELEFLFCWLVLVMPCFYGFTWIILFSVWITGKGEIIVMEEQLKIKDLINMKQ